MPAFFDEGFVVREPAWHGLATVLDDYPGREEAIRLAGHDWSIEQRDVFVQAGGAALVKMDQGDFKALVRSDTNEVLSIQRGSYTPIQNSTLWDIIDEIVKDGNAKYETAGVLKGGNVVWVLIRLDEPVQVFGDNSETYPYVSAYTSHDATMPCAAMATSVRVVCWNTIQAAVMQSKASGHQFVFRHTKNVGDRIEDAKAALGMVRHQHQEFMELANELAHAPVSQRDIDRFINTFIPEPHVDVLTDRQKANIEEGRAKVRETLDLSRTIPNAHRETAYGLACAGIEYLDYLRRANTDETRFRRAIFDSSSAKRKVIELARKVAS